MIKNDVELNEEVDPKLLIDKLKRDIVQLKEELSLLSGEQRSDALTEEDVARLVLHSPVSGLSNFARCPICLDQTMIIDFLFSYVMQGTCRNVELEGAQRSLWQEQT